jgi:excisionase family DNA binding protein
MGDNWITTVEAATLTGYTAYHIRRLIRTGQVKAQKFGPVWQIRRVSLLAYVRQSEKAGKKRGPKPGV